MLYTKDKCITRNSLISQKFLNVFSRHIPNQERIRLHLPAGFFAPHKTGCGILSQVLNKLHTNTTSRTANALRAKYTHTPNEARLPNKKKKLFADNFSHDQLTNDDERNMFIACPSPVPHHHPTIVAPQGTTHISYINVWGTRARANLYLLRDVAHVVRGSRAASRSFNSNRRRCCAVGNIMGWVAAVCWFMHYIAIHNTHHTYINEQCGITAPRGFALRFGNDVMCAMVMQLWCDAWSRIDYAFRNITHAIDIVYAFVFKYSIVF